MGYTDESCSQASDAPPEEEEKKSQRASVGIGNMNKFVYRPQFKMKSLNSQKSFSSQASLSQKSHSQSQDDNNPKSAA